MELQKLAEKYDVNSITEYIIESIINGAISQAKELFEEMDYQDKMDFIHSIKTGEYGEGITDKALSIYGSFVNEFYNR
jgi:hypoxanthine-guanine phosphoribosyltransferase